MMSSKKQMKVPSSSSSSKMPSYEYQQRYDKRDHYLQQMIIDNQRRAIERRNEMARLRRENLAKGFAALDAELPEANTRRTQVRVLNDATEYVRVLKNQGEGEEGDATMRDDDNDQDMQ
ncbi:predicted protein [Lichtheimia corymbifera JMRC:FSU:9682]|uniref:BHLH domain-containing protein n=1 Tax=Lichtheimia corymbifera JMRC:FSU:9682 TaxID=1263082 RepID=A0A068S526_9FUNG|nr:predicted protein [Lichtheimia corymbifera JMRC:FSU:9682]